VTYTSIFYAKEWLGDQESEEIIFLLRPKRGGNWILYSLRFVTSEQYWLKKKWLPHSTIGICNTVMSHSIPGQCFEECMLMWHILWSGR
jgi:hypothetical protein